MRTFRLYLAATIVAAAGPQLRAERLDRENLLQFRDSSGAVRPVRTTAEWQRRRAEILRGMQEVMGPLPDRARRVPLEVQVEEEVDCGTYLRRRISYAAERGSRVPAFLLLPKAVRDAGSVRRPGILCLMPTNQAEGNRPVVGLGSPAAKPGRNYGEELAQRGCVVIAPPYPQLADYQPDLRALGYVSGTMKAIWDNMRALDVLEATPGVDPHRFGAIGHSLGGHNAIYTAVFDERIHVVVSSCGFDSFLDYQDERSWRPERGWAQTRYMPRLLDYPRTEIPFDFHELAGALAPRAFLAIAPLGDTNFKWRSVERIVAAARPVYALHAAPDRLAVEYPDCGHDFPPAMRELAYAWLAKHLGGP